jgi:hypothetical protein
MGLLALIPVIGELVEKVVPDPNKRMELQAQLATLAEQESQRESTERVAQINLNNTEAQHRSIFVAGWRPAIGWTGALSLFMYYPVQIAWQLVEFNTVKLDVTDLLAIIAGLLGFGIQRSYEKTKGVSSDAPLGKPVDPIVQKIKNKVIPEWAR